MISSERLRLRPLRREDSLKTLEWRNDIGFFRLTMGVRFPKTAEMENKWFDKILSDTSNHDIYFGIEEKRCEELIGYVSLNEIDYISGVATWGFGLGEQESRGKGYGVEFSRLFFDYVFGVLPIRKVVSFTASYNKSCLSMYDKMGFFKQEGVLEQQFYFDGDYHDVVITSVFREDYFKFTRR
jgi:RimJ/RimL family protein N-acetyltransferase